MSTSSLVRLPTAFGSRIYRLSRWILLAN